MGRATDVVGRWYSIHFLWFAVRPQFIRPPTLTFFCDACFGARDGFCQKLGVSWRFDLKPSFLPSQNRAPSQERQKPSTRINVLELTAMLVNVWVMIMLVATHSSVREIIF